MAAHLTLLGARVSIFPRRLCYPAATHPAILKKTLSWTATNTTTATSSLHTRALCIGVQGRRGGGRGGRQVHPHPLLRASTSPLTSRTPLTSPLLLNTPSQRHLSSFSDVLSKVFSVQAASPLDETVTGSVDSAVPFTSSLPPLPPLPPHAHDAAAAATTTTTAEGVDYIPLPPAPPECIEPTLNALGEPTFASLGLAGWSPVGLIQSGLEYMHVTVDLPWWGTIALATVILRTLIFPLVIVSQRNAAKMNNYMPQLQVLQLKMTEARNSGDQLNAARYSQELMVFMKEKGLNPLRNVMVPLAQAPIFISMFVALRRMANLPVDSLKVGGLAWFTDLTVADPYYLLPVITSFTMLATIELGTDGARLSSQNMMMMKYFLRALPFLIFPFTMNFPAAILCYWVSTNLFSLVQVGFLRLPAIRERCNIEALITHKPGTLPQNKKGPIEGFKESWQNMKITREIEERHSYDEMKFKRAGTGPLVRTYKHDPTRKVINVQAKVKGK